MCWLSFKVTFDTRLYSITRPALYLWGTCRGMEIQALNTLNQSKFFQPCHDCSQFKHVLSPHSLNIPGWNPSSEDVLLVTLLSSLWAWVHYPIWLGSLYSEAEMAHEESASRWHTVTVLLSIYMWIRGRGIPFFLLCFCTLVIFLVVKMLCCSKNTDMPQPPWFQTTASAS